MATTDRHPAPLASDRDRYLRLLDAVLRAKDLADTDDLPADVLPHDVLEEIWALLAAAEHHVRDTMPVSRWLNDGLEAERRFAASATS